MKVSRSALLCLGAYLALSLSVALADELLVGLPIALASFVLGALAMRGSDRPVGVPYRAIYAALAAMVVLTALLPPPGPAAPIYTWCTRVYPWFAVPLLALHASSESRLRTLAFALLIAPPIALIMTAPWAVPSPEIDVYAQIQHCTKSLLHGEHPYVAALVDPYRGGFDFGYRPKMFPYLPATLLYSLPGVALAGDCRYALALSYVATLFAFRFVARSLGAPPRLADLFALALALHPRAAFLVGFGWTEPFLAVTVAALVVAATRKSELGASVAAFLLPALKQYVAAPLLLFIAILRPRPRSILIGIAVAALTLLPFVAWSPRATLEGVLWVFHQGPFRDDSLSISALVARFFGLRWGKLPGMSAQILVGVIAYVRLRERGLGGFLLASALSIFATWLFAPQAFMNYYWFVGVLLLAAAVVFAADAEGEPVEDRDPEKAA